VRLSALYHKKVEEIGDGISLMGEPKQVRIEMELEKLEHNQIVYERWHRRFGSRLYISKPVIDLRGINEGKRIEELKDMLRKGKSRAAKTRKKSPAIRVQRAAPQSIGGD